MKTILWMLIRLLDLAMSSMVARLHRETLQLAQMGVAMRKKKRKKRPRARKMIVKTTKM